MQYTKLISSCLSQQELNILQSLIRQKIEHIGSIAKSHYLKADENYITVNESILFGIVLNNRVILLKFKAEYTEVTYYIEKIFIEEVELKKYNELKEQQVKTSVFGIGANDWLIKSIQVFGDNYFAEPIEVEKCKTKRGSNWLLDWYNIPYNTYKEVVIHKKTTHLISFILQNNKVISIQTSPNDLSDDCYVNFYDNYMFFEKRIGFLSNQRQKNYYGNLVLHYEIDETGIHKKIPDDSHDLIAEMLYNLKKYKEM